MLAKGLEQGRCDRIVTDEPQTLPKEGDRSLDRGDGRRETAPSMPRQP
jgi:hypothetical protein